MIASFKIRARKQTKAQREFFGGKARPAIAKEIFTIPTDHYITREESRYLIRKYLRECGARRRTMLNGRVWMVTFEDESRKDRFVGGFEIRV